MITSKRNSKTGLTDKEFSSHFAKPGDKARFDTIEEATKFAKLKALTYDALRATGMDYIEAVTLAEKVASEAFDK